MPAGQFQRYEAILNRMIARVVARAGLTDLNDSSVVKHILAAAAREIDDSNFQLTRLQDVFSIDTAAGDDLDERAKEIQPGTLTRLQPQRAVGYLIFSRGVNTGATITIPIGTVVKTADNVLIRTTEQGVITNTSPSQITGHGTGQDSGPVTAIAVNAGASGNIAVNTAVAFVGKPSGVDAVTNVTAFVQGRDKEADDAFRARIKLFVQSLSRSTVAALEFGAIGVIDPVSGRQVTSAHAFEDPIDRGNVSLYIDDGTGAAATGQSVTGENVTLGLLGPPPNSAVGGEEFLFLLHLPIQLESAVTITSSTRGALALGTDYVLNPASGLLFFITPLATGEVITANYTYFTGLVAAVQTVIDGDPNDQIDFPGIRAAGVLVRVLTPVVIPQTVTAVVAIARGSDQATVFGNIQTAVSSYINGLGISGDVIRNEIIKVMMEVPNVEDVQLSIPADNIPVADNEVARITTLDIDLS